MLFFQICILIIHSRAWCLLFLQKFAVAPKGPKHALGKDQDMHDLSELSRTSDSTVSTKSEQPQHNHDIAFLEWVMAAMILDRVYMVCFVVTTITVTIVLLTNRPDIHL